MMFLEIGVFSFLNMPQFIRKYPSGAEKKQGNSKKAQRLMKNVKVSWTDLLL